MCKVAIFMFDLANFNGLLKKIIPECIDIYDCRVNYQRLIEILKEKCIIDNRSSIRSYFVTNLVKSGGRAKFYNLLESQGFEVIYPDEYLEPGSEWDDWQIKSKLQTFIGNDKIGDVFIISGDHTYKEEADKLLQDGKKIHVVSLYEHVSHVYIDDDKINYIDFREIAKEVIFFPEHKHCTLENIESAIKTEDSYYSAALDQQSYNNDTTVDVAPNQDNIQESVQLDENQEISTNAETIEKEGQTILELNVKLTFNSGKQIGSVLDMISDLYKKIEKFREENPNLIIDEETSLQLNSSN